ncbi:hypothetical protein Patl1_37360 [Pistacia atlantica]|nr:hypothetical protein Patl1_37360 [Pistacia atlantica]
MHSFGYRANAVLTFAVTIVALMCAIASLSDNLNSPSLTAEIQTHGNDEGLSVSTAVFDGVKHLIAFGGYNGKYNNEDTHLLLTGGLEKIFRLLDLNHPDAPPREVDRSPGSVRTIAWLHSDRIMLSSCSGMGSVRLWDVGSGKIVQTLEPKSSVTSAEVSQDGRYITTADGSMVKFWDANQLREKVDEVNSTHGELSKELQSVEGQLVTERSRIFKLETKWNDALLEMFRINYIGTSPYFTCLPWLYHHQVSPMDKFLILSLDGLYQYFTYEEAVSEVVLFIAAFPKGDPAQHLIKLLLTSMSCLISHK